MLPQAKEPEKPEPPMAETSAATEKKEDVKPEHQNGKNGRDQEERKRSHQ